MLTDAQFRAANALADDDTDIVPPVIDGQRMTLGLIPRDYDKVPCGSNGNEFPDSLLIPEDTLKDAYETYVQTRISFFNLRKRVGGYLDSLNQNGYGLCWEFSTIKSYMYAREIAGLVRFMPSWWWIAGKINKWADRGGWCERSAAYLVQHGVPRFDLCPEYSKKYDTPEAEQDAKNHTLTEFWDTSDDKAKRAHQCLSAYLTGFCGPMDFNHMGHSMAFGYVSRFVSLYDFDVDCDNSWGMKSGVDGYYRLKGRKAMPDSAVLFRVTKATNT